MIFYQLFVDKLMKEFRTISRLFQVDQPFLEESILDIRFSNVQHRYMLYIHMVHPEDK
jgi:hypothetical protein